MGAACQPLVHARRVAKVYGSGPGAVAALRGVSFDIAAGEFVAVMGPSGSGKSSLMNLVGLLDRPTGGRLGLLGQDTGALPADRLSALRNRHIGFVFQAYNLLPRRTALGNVELPLIYRGIGGRARRRRAAAALERVGLGARANALPSEMSGGEQQRVAIARALVTAPDLIIADEPTGALDTRTSDQILSLLESVVAEGRTVLIVTHDPAVAVRASRLILIRDGRILRDGPLPTGRSESATAPPPALRAAS